MKITIITTPIHDALGVTAEVSAAIEAKVYEVAAIDFGSFITDVDTLAVVLRVSHPSVLEQYVYLPSSDARRVATEKALGWYEHPESVHPLVKQGYFTHHLRKLLAIAKAEDLHGVKLVPVFAAFLEHSERYGLDQSLVHELQSFLVLKDYIDGFLLIEQSEDECVIQPCCWQR